MKSLMVHEVDPKNALGTIDLENIDSVTADDQERRCDLIASYLVCFDVIRFNVLILFSVFFFFFFFC